MIQLKGLDDGYNVSTSEKKNHVTSFYISLTI